MGYVVKMPKLGLEMERGTLLKWYVEEGEAVEDGEVVAEIESEKSIGEIEARENGILRVLALEEGETVPPGTPIGVIAGEDEEIEELRAEVEAASGEDEAAPEADEEGAEPEEAGTEPADPATGSIAGSAGGSAAVETKVRASPRAKQRAEELEVDLAGIEGSGPGGAITEEDVEAAATAEDDGDAGAESGATSEIKASPRAKRRAEELGVDLVGIEGSGPGGAVTEGDVEAVAEKAPDEATPVTAGRSTAPEGVTTGRYDTATVVVEGGAADALIETTGLAASAFDVEASPLDVLAVAVSAALNEHPAFNATFVDGTHQLHRRQDLKIAVESDGERVEPVLEGVESRSFADLVGARHDRAETAAPGDGSTGRATFSLAFGGSADAASAIVPPAVAGLLADASRRRAVPAENGVSLERCLSLSLTYDTRVLGDRDAEAFLETLLDRIDRAPELLLGTYGNR